MRSFAAAARFPDIANIVLAATISGVSELTTMIAMLLHVLMATGCNCKPSVYGHLFAASGPQLGAVAPIAGSYIFAQWSDLEMAVRRWRTGNQARPNHPLPEGRARLRAFLEPLVWTRTGTNLTIAGYSSDE